MPHSQNSAPRDGFPKVRLARGSSPWLLPTVATAAVSLARARRSRSAAIIAGPATALAAGMLWFFRDPEREIAEGRVISPADGVVQSIMPWKDGRTRVAIFMSPLNVHVNRAPLAGTVTSVEHVPGGFVPAFNKESENNERVVWHFDTELGDIELVQIAGTVARRIIPYLPEGTKVEQGDRIGLIRFGSRVDIYLPEGIEVAVEVGQTTTAGVTRIDRA
ncbi:MULTISPECIES: phosphatidylserine decarboxylase [Streptomyces]|uniref:Phosphatidylserine decarboxylase proenzyme n=1 Tax=Streptomyces tsukubensis (strain DSM 42081 / NBRC 108919 / NRRL 18488 / 9993) TaxID=1114943 RepID=I2N957_STRT9|nr:MULTISPECIES: phosphatidylserine decarboxylase [Streptomyces]AZK97406.1 phosphatidylserine decarboxylase [Streptomyces tsukubensis]EIF93554.1 phosphatidylserine decarboxylase [Streptomyces tsukubensis NRRL18488]MYS65213.1 phosphatidylserine decarboxylase [Streptomyces sp. SID5473]QKM66638.1 phosphatidylserine decarboxylase family protein [Streptomyces tsukubensis NRRL18488]TAI45016.1 phosphatidylserine decarboxylase [Streptomyces tsukubensis]